MKSTLTELETAGPLVSVILVNWNRVDEALMNLLALRRQAYRHLQIIVVDNGSTDGSREKLAAIPDIKLVALDANLGPCKARNLGLRQATGKYALFIDSDALMARRGIGRVVRRMEADPKIGIAGCKVINYFSRKIDQWIYHQPYEQFGDQEFDTYSFSAAGAMVKLELIKQLGGFWDDLFIYNEEVDLSIRVIRSGHRVIYFPATRVFHRVSPKGRAKSSSYFFYQIRNWIWIFYRYYPTLWRWRKIATYVPVYLAKGLAAGNLGACVKGIAAGLKDTGIIARYADKLSAAQVAQLEQLNRRQTIRFGR